MKNFIAQGETMEHAHTAAITSGTALQIGKRIGVAAGDYAANESGTYLMEGVVELPAATASVFAIGDEVFWDVADGEFNVDSAGNDLGGYATEASGDGDVLVKVKLNG